MSAMTRVGLAIVPLSLAGTFATARGIVPQPARPLEPIAAILSAFGSHSVVALSEGTHGNSQSGAFQLALIRDPRFALRVNDIVLEGGNARYQDLMDQYVGGGDVPIESLLRVWDDSTQVQPVGPTWTGQVAGVYAAVRELNRSLPPERRLRILLADPPIDWDQVHSPQDHFAWIAQRDTFPAELIEREVLAKGRHALVIFGNMHFQRKQLLANYESAATGPVATVVSALEQSGSRTRVFSVWTSTDDADLASLQPDVSTWPIPALAMLRGTLLGAADFARYYPSAATRFTVRDGKIEPISRDAWRTLRMEDQFDAVLYLGPKSAITVPPVVASATRCADPAFLPRRLARIALGGLPPIEMERAKALCSSTK